MKKRVKEFLKIFLLASVALFSGLFISAANTTQDELIRLISPIYETLQYITKYYYEKDSLDLDKVVDYGIDGLLKGLGDKFSHYVSPDMLEEEEIEMKGEYGGLGMEVTWDREMQAIEVVAPMYGTPAWKAGIKAGDKIIEIDGTPTSEMTFMEAVRSLRGKPGSKVKIKIYREGLEEPIEMEITREKILLIPVKYSSFDSDIGRIGYIKLTKFMENTYDELESALSILLDRGIKALILDLRDNPGGYLDQAVMVTSVFITEGTIVSIKGTFGDDTVYYTENGVVYRKTTTSTTIVNKVKKQLPENLPLVVLVNKGSASASEILTGAIKDHKRGIVVGEKTFGKGSVQTGMMLSNGGILYLTTAHYITPSGKDIHKHGIEPDVVVGIKLTEDKERKQVLDYTQREIKIIPEEDPYIMKALSVLKKM